MITAAVVIIRRLLLTLPRAIRDGPIVYAPPLDVGLWIAGSGTSESQVIALLDDNRLMNIASVHHAGNGGWN